MDGIEQEQVGVKEAVSLPKEKMTYEEFLEWCDEDTWAEWVDGEVIVLSPAGDRLQDLSDWLAFILRAFAETHDLGVVRSAPFQMKLERGCEPDVLFVAREHLDRLKENYLDGPADVVVEIVSADSVVRDRGEKFVEYEVAGVLEYWLIDPLRRRAEFYRRDVEGYYAQVFGGGEGVYQSEVIPGFWLKVKWLWQEPLPKVLDVLREMELI